MARNQAEQSNPLSVFFLKKYGYFDKNLSYKFGIITWSDLSGEERSSMEVIVKKDNWHTQNERATLNLKYIHTDYWNKKSNMDLTIELTTTPCKFGGKRYWFICPYCWRRVGVIYCIGTLYGCRHCGNIAYYSQFEGGKFRVGSLCETDVEKAYNEIKTPYYKGKPTKRHKRYLRLRSKMDRSWLRTGAKFGKFI